MTDSARVWWARVVMLAGLAWFSVQLVLQQSTGKKAVVLGRYKIGYFIFMVLALATSAALARVALGSGVRRWVLAHRPRLKMSVFAAWLPGGLLLYLFGARWPGVGLRQSEWNVIFAGFYVAATLAMLLVTLDALRAAVRRPEFWMAVASVILALGLLEGAMRYWIHNLVDDERQRLLYDPAVSDPARIKYLPHHYALYVLQAGWMSEDGLDRTNSLGFRGEEVELPKPPGTYRIVALGGSTTYGAGVEDWQDAYPAQLERVLRDEYGYANVEVVNGGVSGYTSWETLISLEFRVLDLEPDLIVLYQNTNDVHARRVLPSEYRGDNSAYRKLWDTSDIERASSLPMRFPSVLWRFAAVNLGWLDVESLDLDRAVSKPCTGRSANGDCLGMNAREAVETNRPIYYERNVRNIVAVAQANQAQVLLLTWAYSPEFEYGYQSMGAYQDAFAEHNEIIRRVSGELGTYFYDFAKDMLPDEVYWTDGRHMTEEGNRLRAELVAAYISEADIIP